MKMSFEGSFHYKQILLPCHRKAGKEPNQNRLETILQEELSSNTPLPSGWCPPDFSCSGCSPRTCASCRLSVGAFEPAASPGSNGFSFSHSGMLSLPCSLPGALPLFWSEGSEMPLISSHSVIPMTPRLSLYEFLFVD